MSSFFRERVSGDGAGGQACLGFGLAQAMLQKTNRKGTFQKTTPCRCPPRAVLGSQSREAQLFEMRTALAQSLVFGI
ncbi:hypothetical protein AAFF_G00225890 [Aldrovandia affinis]|uniref:Uncharacterized protein n=1 Tax=Aldrovandia affinis TaxID=143900 RepID=A0AAD7X1J5_9TELE|nr:hypothetical protein AAFF_G00225890 [Aldrovandia affinis]